MFWPPHIRRTHTSVFALVIAMLALWAHARYWAQDTARALSSRPTEPSIMIPLDENLRPIGRIIEMDGEHFAVCPVVPHEDFVAGASGRSSGLFDRLHWPNASSFVALCASFGYWIASGSRTPKRSGR